VTGGPLGSRHRRKIEAILRRDRRLMRQFANVRRICGGEFWIAAGAIRDRLWAAMHGDGISGPHPNADVDVVWFSHSAPSRQRDRSWEKRLRRADRTTDWSVKNQLRMHRRQSKMPFRSLADALAHWPETATCIAVQLSDAGRFRICAPFGVADLLELRLRPTAGFSGKRRAIFDDRVESRKWLTRFPLLMAV
jgi:uncharacterized protein